MSLVFRFAAVAVLLASFHGQVFADPKEVPGDLQQLLQAMHIEKYASLSFVDENGNAISPDEFSKQRAAGKPVGAEKKRRDNGEFDVILRLTTKERMAAMMRVSSKIKPGEPFPQFRLKQLDGREIDNKALEGRYTLVSFYFAQCAPCIKEVPDLNAFAERRKDVNVLAVTYDSVEESKRFVAEHHLGWPIVPEARKLIGDVGVKAYPTFALVDPQGRVVEVMLPGAALAGGRSIESWLDARIASAQGVSIPPQIAPILQRMKLDRIASLAYQDENGRRIDGAEFFDKLKVEGGFRISKTSTSPDALPDVTLRVQTKEEAEGKFSKLKVGEVFPEFRLARLDHTPVDNKVFEGRYTLVAFYFAECGPCVREVPLLNALAQRRKDVSLLAVTFDGAKQSKEFVEKYGLTWPVVVDAKDLTDKIGVRAYPSMALIDSKGRVVDVVTGGALLENPVTFDAWLDKRISMAE